MSELHPDNYRDLLKYHSSLKQFLTLSNGPTKTNSNRAAKAREKLLKLSASQFFELSTDVYDELQRRIDESSDEPDFLLPKSTFHPKRNEAREKLGSLPQTRFRDLVSDILYEIERRGYNERKFNGTPAYVAPTDSESMTLPPLQRSSKDKQAGVVSVQPTTVIPTKANMAWSSDEEDEDEKRDTFDQYGNGNGLKKVEVEKNQNHSNGLIGAETLAKKSARDSSHSVPSIVSPKQPRYSSNSENDSVSSINNSVAKPNQLSRGLSMTQSRNKDKDIEILIEEGTKMDQQITTLERNINELEYKNNLLQSKSEKFENEAQELTKILEGYKVTIKSLESEVHELRENNRTLTEKVNNSASMVNQSTRDIEETSVLDSGKVVSLTEEVEALKAKLNEYKSKSGGGFPSLNAKFSEVNAVNIAKDGLIPLDLFEKFRQSIEDFLIELNENSKTKKVDSSSTFAHISRISKFTSEIANYSPHSEKSELIRASISHAITSARYYALYGVQLPKLLIESSIGEVVFSVFDLISDIKLLGSEEHSYTSSKSNSESVHKNTDSSTKSEVSPVRPLRMARKGGDDDDSFNDSFSKPLNLTINADIANATDKSTSSITGVRESPINSPNNSSNKIFPSVAAIKSGFPSVVARYSPDSKEKPHDAPVLGLRKSSSGNILSKVRQFEQQETSSPVSKTPSPVNRKIMVSPLSESVVGKFGQRKPSLETAEQPLNSIKGVTKVTGNDTAPQPKDKPLFGENFQAKSQIQPNQALKEKDEISESTGLNENDRSDAIKALRQLSIEDSEDETELVREVALKNSEETSQQRMEPESSKGLIIKENNSLGIKKDLEEPSNDGGPIIKKHSIRSINTDNKPTPTLPEPDVMNSDDESDDEIVKESEDEQDVKSDLRNERGDDFDVDDFDIEDPDNTLSELLLYLEHQTVKVITTIQSLLLSIKTTDSTKGELRHGSKAIDDVVTQMIEATSNSMNQSRNVQLKEHGSWVVDTLANASRRMRALGDSKEDGKDDEDYADKQYRQRLAGIAFDVAKCTKELVKTVEEANLKEEIQHLNKKLEK